VTLGPLIHNPQEVERLRNAGICSVNSLEEVLPGQTVIIRSHGVTPQVYAQCEKMGIPVIDATCPHVAHIHQLVSRYSEQGDAVIIVGAADHPEVIGIAGWASGPVFILHDAKAAEEADLPAKALVVAQTTIRRDRFEEVLAVLRKRVPELTTRKTICAATSQRQEEAERLAAQVVAVPGTSEHHSGLAVDIIDTRLWALEEEQADLPAQQWLMEHCWEYGFILRYPKDKIDVTGIIYEPWHYRYVGLELAKELHDLGLTLEEYMTMLTEAEQ
jgi:hypothetical protein